MNERVAAKASADLAVDLVQLRSICGEDDVELLSDMIEGETSLEAFVGKMIELIGADEADSEGIKAYQQKLAARKKRLDQRAARLRVLLASVVTQLPGRKFRHALASVSAFDVDPKVILTDESQIPTKWWKRPDPVVDQSALRKHLLERERLLQSLKDGATEEEQASAPRRDRSGLSRHSRRHPWQRRHLGSDLRELTMNEIVRPQLFAPPAAFQKFELTKSQLDLIWDINRDLTPREFDQFIETARALGLNPLRRQICTMVFSKRDPARRRMAIVTTIMGLRAIADRTGTYRPDPKPARITAEPKRIDSKANPGGFIDCVVTPYRFAHGKWFPVVGQVWWDEIAPIRTYDGQQMLDSRTPWPGRPRGQFIKCAEADGLQARLAGGSRQCLCRGRGRSRPHARAIPLTGGGRSQEGAA